MYLISFVCFCLCTLTFSAILARCIPLLRSSVLSYGKLQSIATRPTSSIALQLAQWTVPKSWFAHFYVVGLISALYCFAEIVFLLQWHGHGPVLYCLRMWDIPQASSHISVLESIVALALLTLHLARRVYESFCIERPSLEARMHVSHYLAGVGFYGAMVLATWLEGAANFGVWSGKLSPPALDWSDLLCTRVVMATFLFFYASMHQHQCHCILASLRTKKEANHYQIPRGDWFEWIVVPHYFADILVYLSLCILHGFRNWILICGLIWTVINLSITASGTEEWYKAKFGLRYQATFPKGRWIILPGIY
ncbi:3-oxo-5-alpha-steroid 4-dehydrogenase [Lichtheimia corymbifera JMRC:FSU:9682]|uniref:3-oxo-5-alpha-steroid 4-dehydrogenase n=1 Tax=Lichtheimia corymbifera JMRC:FSU:9682 TaxID=1263082 RepID=A0A068S9K3_9FUNG|nr:3-oxo-5-alpha-steroid 4-dehydrogenase [Lichtheimia corymbifera JMRC:FSU:9682]